MGLRELTNEELFYVSGGDGGEGGGGDSAGTGNDGAGTGSDGSGTDGGGSAFDGPGVDESAFGPSSFGFDTPGTTSSTVNLGPDFGESITGRPGPNNTVTVDNPNGTTTTYDSTGRDIGTGYSNPDSLRGYDFNDRGN